MQFLQLSTVTRRLIIASLAIACSAAVANADTIVMKSGEKLVGQVLKVQPDALFIDIGIDVIRIPLEKISERIEDEPSTD